MIVMIQPSPDKSELWIKEVGSRVHRVIGLSELPSVMLFWISSLDIQKTKEYTKQ
jgi:hypothetical protein